MKVYKKTKSGFIEELNTQDGYIPKGWSRTKESASKKK